MNSKKSFIVMNPPFIFRLYIFLITLVAIIILAYTIFTPPPHTAMYICFFIFIIFPAAMYALWTKTFRIKVNDTRIFVRKRFGLVNYNFDISDITNVELSIVDTNFVNGITIFTSKGNKISIGILHTNLDKMAKFIKENIDENKINKIYKSDDDEKLPRN